MPQIPVAGPVAPGDYPSINPQAARSNWDSVAKGAEAAGAVAQFGLETARRLQDAEDHTLALKAENEIQADIESVAQSFAQRNDYENFSKDATAAGEELRRKYNTQYGTNPRLWKALQPHLENQIGKATRAVERRRFDLVGDQRKADLEKKADTSIRFLIATEDPAEKAAIKLDYYKNVEAAVIDGLLTRQEAYTFETGFELKADQAEVSAGLESNNPEVVKSMLARIEDPNEFKTLKAKNAPSVNSMVGQAKRWLDAQTELNLGLDAAQEAWDKLMPEGTPLNTPVPAFELNAELNKNEKLKENKGAYAAAKSELSTKMQLWNAQQLEFVRANTDAVYGMFNKGATPAQIKASHEFQQLGDQAQTQFMAALAQIQQAAESRRRADEEYALGRNARILSSFRAGMDLTFLQHAGEYWRDSDPANLTRMTEQEITAKASLYGPEKTQKLLQDRRDLIKKGPEATYIVTTSELLKRAARDAGILPSTGNPNAKQQKEFAIFEDEIQRRLTEFETSELRGTRKANQTEIKTVIDEVQMDKVYSNEFGRDPERLKILTPSDADAYVVIDGKQESMSQIPSARLDEIVGALREAKLPVTSTKIMSTWIRMGRPSK